MPENAGENLKSTVNRLMVIVYEGSANNDSIFMVSKMTRNQEERIRTLERRMSTYEGEDRKARSQIFWLLVTVLVLAIARALNIDFSHIKNLTGM